MTTESEVIWVGNDHGGYELKREIIKYCGANGFPVYDIGCHSEEIVRYPHYAARLAEEISSGRIRRGILICSTGIGMSIVANRFRGVRASLCTSTYLARMTREHNNSNLLCLGGRVTGLYEALDIVETWLNTSYQGGRHDISLNLIQNIDAVITAPESWDFFTCPNA
jgi:ribose 5-phosphate isomerase B